MKRKSKSIKKSARKRMAPSQHASETKVGTVMTGNDGKVWIVAKVMGGKRWKRFSNI